MRVYVYIYHSIGVNQIESWRCECIGAFVHYSIDTVCAFYLISPSTARLRVFASMKFVFISFAIQPKKCPSRVEFSN